MKRKFGLMLLAGVCLFGFGCGKGKEETKKAEPKERIVVENNWGKAKEAAKMEEEAPPEEAPLRKKIAIDAGHQQKGNNEKEPVGPGAGETKAKVASGTSGVVTGVPEYELTLAVSAQLKQVLEDRGYEVIMIRESNDVNISNAQRAKIANDAGADAFVRVHGNGAENAQANGALTMCMTQNNPYNANLYEQSRRLSDKVLEYLCSVSGAQKNSVIETDNMSGINWCKVPVTIVELGFMTNAMEDEQMQSSLYQSKMAQGIADGIDAYFETN